MQYYKKLMALIVGLFFAIFSGALSAEFIEVSTWYLSLPLPEYAAGAAFFQIAWLVVYIFSAMLISETISTTKLRKNMIYWAILHLLQPVWCFVFFTLHYVLLSLLLLTVLFLVQLLLFFKTLQIKKWTPFFSLPILVWYMYLIALIYGTVLCM